QFTGDPVKQALADRGRYIACVLTIVRAYILADQPRRLAPLASFESWSNLVRSALVWLDCADPVATITNLQTNDPRRQEALALFAAWASKLKLGEAYSVRELIAHATPGSALHDALEDVAAVRGVVDPGRLGRWLSRWCDTILDGYSLHSTGTKHGSRTAWVLVRVEEGWRGRER